ncbi:MAG: hypothetical protein WD844_02580 [Thermoleophilaceae bacterium]
MDFSRIKEKAKGIIEKRGGTDALKEDVNELKDIASGQGRATDKAKEAAEALKDPGAPGPEQGSRTRDQDSPSR